MLERISRAVRTIRAADGPNPINWWTMDVGLPYWRSTIVGVVAKDLVPEDRASFVFDLVERQGLNETRSCTALLFDVAVDRKTPVAVLFFPARNGEVPQ